MSNLFNYDDIEIDEVKLRKMRLKIYFLEKEFYRTRKYTIGDMKRRIRKIIEEEYRKNV